MRFGSTPFFRDQYSSRRLFSCCLILSVFLLTICTSGGCGKPSSSNGPHQTDAQSVPADASTSDADAQTDNSQLEPAEETSTADGLPDGQPPAEVEATPANDIAAMDHELGQQLYERHCAGCHGAQGDGKGVAAAYLFPKPRDFQAGRFRLVSTSNNVPSREDLQAVLLRGMPGSAMPPWRHLSQAERDALVDEVMRLRQEGARALYVNALKEQEQLTDEEIAEDEDLQQDIQDVVSDASEPGESSQVPNIGPPTDEVISQGKEAYAKFGCVKCHGEQGKGDGVEKMVDSEGYPTAPRDFTLGIFKGGDDPQSLYRRIAYGMPGTPMPSSQQMSPEEVVSLVHYVRSMSTEEQLQAAVLKRERIVVQSRASVPADAGDAAWSEIAATSLRVMPLWWRNDADARLQVQAVYDGQTIAVRISWDDATQNAEAVTSASFQDAAAMELYRGDAEPFLGMGGPKSNVDVWFWGADRQNKPPTVEQRYPNTVVDNYPFSETAVASAELDRDGARTADQPDISLPARASGNQIVPHAEGPGASSLAADGPGSVTFRPAISQDVHAVGEWHDGRWSVVMTRQLKLASPDDGLSLTPGETLSAAFAIWDGTARDRDGQKRITIWQDLVLEK